MPDKSDLIDRLDDLALIAGRASDMVFDAASITNKMENIIHRMIRDFPEHAPDIEALPDFDAVWDKSEEIIEFGHAVAELCDELADKYEY